MQLFDADTLLGLKLQSDRERPWNSEFGRGKQRSAAGYRVQRELSKSADLGMNLTTVAKFQVRDLGGWRSTASHCSVSKTAIKFDEL